MGLTPRAFPRASNSSMKMMLGARRLRLREEVAHAGRADAHKHLDEVGPAQAEEGHPGFARHGLGQEGFAGPGGPDEQHPLGDACRPAGDSAPGA